MDVNREQGRTEVAIVGAGIVGLFNALQFAKRGIRVTLLDDLTNRKESFKVGESLLVFSNPFLRTLGGLDEFMQRESVQKKGVWFIHGAEGKESFEGTNEWALERTLPPEMEDDFPNKLLFRAGVEDMQIVRPEAEAEMLRQVREFPEVEVLDTARVKDVELGEDGEPNRVSWVSRSTGTEGVVEADWVMDCSGRVRMLAKKFGHCMKDEIGGDGFQTTAVWAQFGDVDKDLFDETWTFNYSDQGSAQRHGSTVHLWGDGYWIWIINLSKGRLSVGATFNQEKAPDVKGMRGQFWNIIRRYPPLSKLLSEDNLLEFRAYKNVQYMTDTVVSKKRYGLAGDSASIIDAYYSQGMSHAFVTSWHIANIIEEDLRKGHLNETYIDRVNLNIREDWRMVRNMVRAKFGSAIGDGRFFLISHLLDLLTFYSIGIPKVQLTMWLAETGGSTAAEKPIHRDIREYLSRRLFYSRGYTTLPATVARKLQGHMQKKLEERAIWRLENDVKTPDMKCIQRFNAGPIPFWRTFRKPSNTPNDVSPNAITAAPPKFMKFTGQERWPLPLMLIKGLSTIIFLILYVHDWFSTSWAKLGVGLRKLSGGFSEGPQTLGAGSVERSQKSST